ncbi:MAG: hypothetical protein A2297_01680 [Elusimicrobia bacterium RIFOXYB2_FULL_48_7]|nr:MAG: hypothetical protein A2297_01680 [Elusimicrobia bacterium RIFOXYB2_FULL_48_7]
MEPTNQSNNQKQVTAGQVKEKWSEFLFGLALFFGVLHYTAVLMDVFGQYYLASFGKVLSMPMESSMIMGNIYLGVLAAYVGQKEFLRWISSAKDDDEASAVMRRKISRGELIVGSWALLAGATVFLWQLKLVASIPAPLLYTLGEVFAIYFGTNISKYLKQKNAKQAIETESDAMSYGSQALEYARSNGSVDNEYCQKQFGLSKDQAYRLLNRLEKRGVLKASGGGRNREYRAG